MTTVLEPPLHRQQGAHPHTLPHDDDAERCVLGGMMQSADSIADAIEVLKDSTAFYDPKHVCIFNAILKLYNDGQPVDAITVAHALDGSGDLNRAGGAPYLHTCLADTPTVAHTTYYARIVAGLAVRRRLIEGATRVLQLGYGTTGHGLDPDAITDQAQQIFYDIGAHRSSESWMGLGDLLQPALDEIEMSGRAGPGLRGIATGFADLDRLLGGFLPGQLIVVAARPGLGKSTLALDFVRAASIRQNLASAVFSMEMSKVEIVLRLLSAEARVSLHALRSGQLSDDDWTKLARRMGEIGDSPMFIDDTANMSLMEIRSKARRLRQRHDVKLIVVDYLQLMTSAKRSESRQQEVSEISRGLKLLAKEVECPVIAVSQLNRGPEQRTDKRPQLSDLRESGAIEQDSDVVILLHRDDYYDKETPRAGEADIIVAKHRNGPVDTVTVAAQLHLSRFVDMAIN